MARPIKNNADYFPHDADMRNDAKVKAVRRKFGLEGYAIYCMIIEYLAHSEHFKTKIDNLGLELMAGDFDIDSIKLMEVIQYSVSIELFQLDNLILTCYSLEKRLNPLLSKRERDRDRIIDSENTHSKVKESKGNKSKEKGKKEEDIITATKVATIEDRQKVFMERLTPHLQEYSKEMLREFFDYWVEKNDGGRKMRFEMQKVFDVSRRLKTWKRNNYSNGTRTNNKREQGINSLKENFGKRVIAGNTEGAI